MYTMKLLLGAVESKTFSLCTFAVAPNLPYTSPMYSVAPKTFPQYSAAAPKAFSQYSVVAPINLFGYLHHKTFLAGKFFNMVTVLSPMKIGSHRN